MSTSNRAERHLSVAPITPAVIPDQVETVGEYLEDWLSGKQSLRPSTHASYEIHVRRHLKPYLGVLALAALRPVHIERMYQELGIRGDRQGKPLSVSTLRRVHATLMSALNTAVRRGLIDRNPATTVELRREPRPTMHSWTAAEMARFLDATSNERLHLLFLVLGIVGLRRGEAVALRWSDLDLNRGTLRVERSVVRLGSQFVTGPPKSATGSRTVALDEETCRRLHWHQCRQRLEVLRSTGHLNTPDLVFTTIEGEQLDPAYVSRLFERLQGKTGLPRIRLHDLRHTSASIGLASGEPLVEVSRRLGHSSIIITADIYSHVAPQVAKESAERLAATIYRTQDPQR